MSFFSKLLGAFRGQAPAGDDAGRNAFWVYVRCDACGEPIRVRINREHDLTAEYDEGSDAASSFHVHKEVVGQRCFRRIQVDLTFDGQRKVSDQQAQGGAFLTREEYEAALAETPPLAPPIPRHPPPPPPLPPPPDLARMQPPALPALRWTSPSPTVLTALVAGGGAVAAAGLGWVAATRSPLIAGGLLGALAFAGVALRRPVLALYGLIAVVALLPFGVPPLRLGVAPTLLDLSTVLVFLLWVALAATGRMSTRLAGPGAAILAFATVAGAAALLSDAPFRPDGDGRTFLKLLLATLLFVPVLGFASRPGAARRLTAWLLLLCALQALLGLALYFAPRTLSYRALVALGPLGYPTDGSVLRYRPDTEILRATGTAVDPNMLGALLMVGAAIAVPILLAPRPALPRRPLLLVLALLLPCLLLTESRGSWLGLAGALGVVAAPAPPAPPAGRRPPGPLAALDPRRGTLHYPPPLRPAGPRPGQRHAPGGDRERPGHHRPPPLVRRRLGGRVAVDRAGHHPGRL